MNYHDLLSHHPITTDQVDAAELAVILRELQSVLQRGPAGAVVEFGCYQGTTSLFLRRLLDQAGQSDQRALHVYDSFAGLPPKSKQDASGAGLQFTAGELSASKKQVVRAFRQAGLQLPIIHAGWFDQLTGDDVPSLIAFAFLDGDFYHSIIDSLELVWPRLAPKGVICIDDYQREALPGVERAVHDFFRRQAIAVRHEASIAIINKS